MIGLRCLCCIFLLVSFSSLVAFQQKPEPYIQIGEASYYARIFEGKPTASGALYFSDSLTAAHKTLPFGTIVKVTNLKNNKAVLVKVNDRGPFTSDRIIDLSLGAAKILDIIERGVSKVKLEVVKPAQNYSLADSIE